MPYLLALLRDRYRGFFLQRRMRETQKVWQPMWMRLLLSMTIKLYKYWIVWENYPIINYNQLSHFFWWKSNLIKYGCIHIKEHKSLPLFDKYCKSTPLHNLPARVGPGSELEVALLIVKGEPGDVNLARRLERIGMTSMITINRWM